MAFTLWLVNLFIILQVYFQTIQLPGKGPIFSMVLEYLDAKMPKPKLARLFMMMHFL
jgi:hypothetical protein